MNGRSRRCEPPRVRRRPGLLAFWILRLCLSRGQVRAACSASNSAGGRSPSDSCRRVVLNQATYSTIASSSCERLRQTRSAISSVLNVSTKLSASALS